MRAPRAEWIRRARAALLPVAILSLAPKCALCLLAYAGLGAALGLGRPELCGGSSEAPGLAGPALVALGCVAWHLRRRAARLPARHCTARSGAELSGPGPLSPRR